MHFVSEYAGRKLVRPQQKVFSQATGEHTHTLPTVWLELERGKAPDWAVEQAAGLLAFSTRPVSGSIGGADIPIAQWCCYVDTVQWQTIHGHDDELRERAEEILLGSPGEVRQVTPPELQPPWRTYDKLTVRANRPAERVADQNIATAAEVGVEVDELIAYERATRADPEILARYEKVAEALRAKRSAEPAEAEVVVSA